MPQNPTPALQRAPTFHLLRGRSAAMRSLFVELERLSRTDLSVLIEGPTGSGKDLAARTLHDHGVRSSAPFVVLDCAALSATLAEATLFGHAKGAFTGAAEARAGVFEEAHGGTVFIDEIGDLPRALQPKLLRVLENREVTRVGENRPRPAKVRVISATWRDLRGMVTQGTFRDDLYFRVAQTRVAVPSLAERRDDVELLAQEFLRELPLGASCARAFSPDALTALTSREYPGNVRELRNLVERAACLANGPIIGPEDLIERGRGRVSDVFELRSDESNADQRAFKSEKRWVLDAFERRYLELLMARTRGNIAMAAGLAGLERHYLRALLKKHGLHTVA